MQGSLRSRVVAVAASALVACAAASFVADLGSPARSDAKPGPSARPKLLFGIGPEADAARRSPLAVQSHVRLLSSWFNGSADLGFMSAWRTTEIPRAYRDGYALHLIVHSNDPEVPLSTRYGAACGRAYPLSDQFLADMRALAHTFAGAAAGPPLYVTLFTEFQTYPCMDNAWARDAATRAYYLALKDRYRATLKIFHKQAANAEVSLGWGGWQADFDDPADGGGRSMFCHFADVMADSDFQSFQAMDSGGNVDAIAAMTRTLGSYGPVMLAHMKPDDGSQATFDSDVHTVLTSSSLKRLRRQGLFALSFMDSANLDGQPTTLDFVAHSVTRFGLGSATQAKLRALLKAARRASDSRGGATHGARGSCGGKRKKRGGGER